MGSLTQVLEEMKQRFNPVAAKGLDVVFQFIITDGEAFYLKVANETYQLVTGEYEDSDVTLTANTDTFVGILSGKIKGMQAFMNGTLKISGNVMLATKLGDLFPS